MSKGVRLVTDMFKEFVSILRRLLSNKDDLAAQINETEGRIAALRHEAQVCFANLDTAGAGQKLIEADKLEATLKVLKHQFTLADKSEEETKALAKQSNTRLRQVAEQVLVKNKEAVGQLQADYNQRKARLEALTSEFLGVVYEMGQIDAKAEKLAKEMREVQAYVPGRENDYMHGIANVEQVMNLAHRTGVAHIDPREVENRYRTGKESERTA